jgi:hypothetical protein
LAGCFDEVCCFYRGDVPSEVASGDINTDYYVIVDNIGESRHIVSSIAKMKKKGIKIVVVTYDPPSFKDVDFFDALELVDLVITFDRKFSNRFKCKQYVCDYVFNPEYVPQSVKADYSNRVCIYGTVTGVGRNNRFNLPKIDDYSTDYQALYRKIQDYNGVHVLTPGLDEDSKELIHYNKAKPIEVLLCGRNPYCEDGLDYIDYNKYLKTSDMIACPVPVDFDREDIVKINEKNVRELKEHVLHVV